MTGTQIGNYKILEKLGEGGMGVVYKAVDVNLDRTVAVKALNTELTGNPELEQRFRAEAKAQANLNHTNLATLYALLIEEGRPWMVMEYIEGETFEQMVLRRGPIPGTEAVPLFRQALLGVGYAHRMGVVHRDIKPSNIMLNKQGIVKVILNLEQVDYIDSTGLGSMVICFTTLQKAGGSRVLLYDEVLDA